MLFRHSSVLFASFLFEKQAKKCKKDDGSRLNVGLTPKENYKKNFFYQGASVAQGFEN